MIHRRTRLDFHVSTWPTLLCFAIASGCDSKAPPSHVSSQAETSTVGELVADAGSNHDCWVNGVSATDSCVTALQPASNADGTYQVTLSQLSLGQPYQAAGLMLYQDDSNFLRFELWTMGTGVFADAWQVRGGQGSQAIGGPAVPLGSSIVLRVAQSGGTFVFSYSLDGVTFDNAGTFSASLSVTQAGPYVDNAGGTSAPYTSADYAGLHIPGAVASCDSGCCAPPVDNGMDASPETGAPSAPPLVPSGPIVIDGQSSGLIQGLKITSTTGACVTITNSANVTVRASEIGPCGGNAVAISGGGSLTIEDNYIHPDVLPTSCCDTGDGVLVQNANGVTIAGNVIAFGESNIEALGSQNVTAKGNFLLNPQNTGGARGCNFQAWNGSSNIVVENNYALGSLDPMYAFPENQSDSLNFGDANGVVVQNNYVEGGHWASGCGIIADDAANSVQFLSNIVINTSQVGINIGSGTNQVVDGNRILGNIPITGGGNTALTVWNEYTDACGPVSVTNNIAAWLKPDGTESGYWNGGGCEPVTLGSENIFDAPARALLTPVDQKLPAPLIPPAPVSCVAPSPYATQTGWPPCASP